MITITRARARRITEKSSKPPEVMPVIDSRTKEIRKAMTGARKAPLIDLTSLSLPISCLLLASSTPPIPAKTRGTGGIGNEEIPRNVAERTYITDIETIIASIVLVFHSSHFSATMSERVTALFQRMRRGSMRIAAVTATTGSPAATTLAAIPARKAP